jgi:hypothetical protein
MAIIMNNQISIFLILIYMLICTHNFKLEISPLFEKVIVTIFGILVIFFGPNDDLVFSVLNVVVVVAGYALFLEKKRKQQK